jgi:hypothetical protein
VATSAAFFPADVDRSMAAIAPVAELLHGNFLRLGLSEWRSTPSDRDAHDYGQRRRGSALMGCHQLRRQDVAKLLRFRCSNFE